MAALHQVSRVLWTSRVRSPMMKMTTTVTLPAAVPGTGVREGAFHACRLDLYGPTGEGPWPWFEYVRLAVFGVVLLFRLIAFVFLVAVFFAICHLHTRIRLPWARRLLERVDMTIAHTSLPVAFGVLPRVFRVSGPPVGAVEDFRRECRMGARVRDVELPSLAYRGSVRFVQRLVVVKRGALQTVAADEDGRLMKPPLVVPNHCGWIDIVVTSSLFFPSFVARAGTEKLPLAGIAAVVFQFILVTGPARADVPPKAFPVPTPVDAPGLAFAQVEREKAKDAIAGASAARAQEGNGTAVAGGRQQAQPPSGSASETVGGAPGAENASGSTQPFSAAAKQVTPALAAPPSRPRPT